MRARGLRFLVSEYCAQLLCHWKETARVSQLTRSAEPATGEDVDLERHYEHLPLSPVLLAAGTSSMQNLREPTRLANLHAVLMDYKETVEKSIRSGDSGCLSLSSHEEILGCMCSYLHQKDYWKHLQGAADASETHASEEDKGPHRRQYTGSLPCTPGVRNIRMGRVDREVV